VYCSRLEFLEQLGLCSAQVLLKVRLGLFTLHQKKFLLDVLLCAGGCFSMMIFGAVLSTRVHYAGFVLALVEASRVVASLSCWLLPLLIPILASISFGSCV
jgi:hypothetical protein